MKEPKLKKKKKFRKIGLPPGSLIYTGIHATEKITIEVYEYDQDGFWKKEFHQLHDIPDKTNENSKRWINVFGIHDIKLMEETAKEFNLHPLLVEDILNPDQRPKLEDLEQSLFCTLKMLSINHQTLDIESEQISLILGEDFVLSFQEKPEDIFNPIRDRIERSKGRLRAKGSDYLLYALLDVVVDNYFTILDAFADEIELLEEEVFQNPSEKALQKVQKIKKSTIFLKRSIYPVREIAASLSKSNHTLINQDTRAFFSDIYDHTINLTESIETYREWNAELKEVYLSSLSNKLNQVMKVLTIISTIFIPLTFIAGIYGMNFKFMPELESKYGYFIVLVIMAILTVAMLLLFKKKKWL